MAEQTSFGTAPVSPRRGESAELVLAGIERKHQDPENHERPDSEQAPANTEPLAHSPLSPIRGPEVPRSTPEPTHDAEGNPLVICKFCGERVSRAWDEGNSKVKPGYRYLDRALANEGTYLARKGQASWWGSRQGTHKRHDCRKMTLQDMAG